MSSEDSNALIVVAKRPAPGRTKTRLSPPLTLEMASQLYECFLLDTLAQIRRVRGAQKVIAYLDEEAYFEQLAPDFLFIQQEGANLGARLDHALTTFFLRGYEHVVIMNSDSPTLPVSYLTESFNALANGADVVLGPCDDGGYYLIGMNKPTPRLLLEVQMSTPSVAAETMALAREEDLELFSLPVWYDVDDGASLSRLVEELEMETTVAVSTRQFLRQEEVRKLISKGA